MNPKPESMKYEASRCGRSLVNSTRQQFTLQATAFPTAKYQSSAKQSSVKKKNQNQYE
ncbi:hypothetical protein QG37_00083 [Candidozyma auris]|uniref:Uncharacterized protein n=1 Tax=Candidozyma auris TaxID=498019 RepID=A0A0L0P9H9_CANAR|nr:hypothetical protein QG37_00083 [[Candida] auris]